MKPTFVLLAVGCLLSAGLGQHWEIEQVDSAGWGAGVQMRRHPDLGWLLCYRGPGGVIRLAWSDLVWHYEDMPFRHSLPSGVQGLNIGHRGEVGIAYADSFQWCWYALKSAAGWEDVAVPYPNPFPWAPIPTAFDTAGAPMIALQVGLSFILARRSDSLWTSDTLVSDDPMWNPSFSSSAIGMTADGVVWGVLDWSYYFGPQRDVYGTNLYRFYVADSVGLVYVTGVANGSIAGVAGCIDSRDSVHTSCGLWSYSTIGLLLDQTLIDTARVVLTSVRFDTLGRPHVAYVLESGELLYRYRGALGWRTFDVGVSGVSFVDLKLDGWSQPLIAYSTADGVFLAHGEDVVGADETERQPVPAPAVCPSIARHLPASTVVFDATGRRVQNPRPGVYFVREAQAQGVTKVVLTR